MKYKKDGIEVEGVFYKLEDIVQKCNDIKIEEKDLSLLSIGWSGRGGGVYESICLVNADAHRMEELLTDKEVNFGEIWGKHSEVYGRIKENDINISNNKQEVINFLKTNPDGHIYDHSFIYNYTQKTEDQIDEEDFIEDGHEKDIKEIEAILKRNNI